jgi:hypothetical protein
MTLMRCGLDGDGDGVKNIVSTLLQRCLEKHRHHGLERLLILGTRQHGHNHGTKDSTTNYRFQFRLDRASFRLARSGHDHHELSSSQSRSRRNAALKKELPASRSKAKIAPDGPHEGDHYQLTAAMCNAGCSDRSPDS